ncbi:MAG: hypothetical protein CMQ41_04595 [Gammaproteobacteria bacterium]|nr:hypothetical protein [Gammaproteobacteria bacterium]
MKRNIVSTLFFLLGFSGVSHCLAQLNGDWMLTIDHDAERLGVISFEQTDEGIKAFVDGGPVDLKIDAEKIEMVVDYRDSGGRLLSRKLTGIIGEESINGTLIANHDDSVGTWVATRMAQNRNVQARPVDISGIWSRISAGMEKVDLDYTTSAQALVDNYNYLDDPGLRCVSPGLVRLSGWPYPMEIIQGEKQITILYESFREVRRIYMDGREIPENLPASAMGYSRAHWEGSTLVVETSLLKPNFVDQAGQPISDQAKVVERIVMGKNGRNLRSLLTLYDPQNYERPVIRYRQWRKTPDATISEYDCDSYPFYRGLQLEGRLTEFLDRVREQQAQ